MLGNTQLPRPQFRSVNKYIQKKSGKHFGFRSLISTYFLYSKSFFSVFKFYEFIEILYC